MMRTLALSLMLVCALLSTAASCGTTKRSVTTVGQAGVVIAKTLGEMQTATTELTDAGVIAPATAIAVHERLLAVNARLKPLPGILRTIDRLTAIGEDASSAIDAAIEILIAISEELSLTIGGVPVNDATETLVALVRAAQQTVITTVATIAQFKGGAK